MEAEAIRKILLAIERNAKLQTKHPEPRVDIGDRGETTLGGRGADRGMEKGVSGDLGFGLTKVWQPIASLI